MAAGPAQEGIWRCWAVIQVSVQRLRCCCCCPGQLLAHQGAGRQALLVRNMLQNLGPELLRQFVPAQHFGRVGDLGRDLVVL